MENFQLRLLEVEDSANLYHLFQTNRIQFSRYFPITNQEIITPEKSHDYLVKSQTQQKLKQKYLYGILIAEKLIGVLFIKNIDWRIPKCELGYFLDKDFQGQGLMTQALEILVHSCLGKVFIFKIYLRIDPNNTPSVKLALRLGFHLEACLKNEFRLETGKLADINYYALFNERID